MAHSLPLLSSMEKQADCPRRSHSQETVVGSTREFAQPWRQWVAMGADGSQLGCACRRRAGLPV